MLRQSPIRVMVLLFVNTSPHGELEVLYLTP
jgi:hypothetical protein